MVPSPPERAPPALFLLLASNRRPRLHLALAIEALEGIAPVQRELGRHAGPAVEGSGWYENRLLLCRPFRPEVAAIECAAKRIERRLAPRRGRHDCPLDLDPFLLVHARGVQSFARTAKVLALLARLDPLGRLGFDRAVAARAALEWL